jgi:hypothetical protein
MATFWQKSLSYLGLVDDEQVAVVQDRRDNVVEGKLSLRGLLFIIEFLLVAPSPRQPSSTSFHLGDHLQRGEGKQHEQSPHGQEVHRSQSVGGKRREGAAESRPDDRPESEQPVEAFRFAAVENLGRDQPALCDENDAEQAHPDAEDV